MKYIFLILIITFFFLRNTGFSQEAVVIKNLKQNYLIGKHCQKFIDINSNMKLEEVIKSKQFVPSLQDVPNLGIGKHSCWLKFKIRNETQLNQLLLDIPYPILNKIDFFEIDNSENYSSKFNLAGTGSLKEEKIVSQNHVTRKVQTTLLDDWVAAEKLTKLDLIKIDTEGTEHLILQGSDQVLRVLAPIIICETLFHVIEEELEKIMSLYDYRFFNYRQGKLYETKTLIRETDNGFRDCFFVPAKKVSWIQPFMA